MFLAESRNQRNRVKHVAAPTDMALADRPQAGSAKSESWIEILPSSASIGEIG